MSAGPPEVVIRDATAKAAKRLSINRMIVCSSMNCETCEARIATIKNNDKMRLILSSLLSPSHKVA